MKLSKQSILTLPFLLLIGCSDSPKNAITNMYDALIDGNSVKLANNVRESTNIVIISEALKKCSISEKIITDQIKRANECLKEEYENLNYENIKILSNDGNISVATVDVSINNGKKQTTTLILIKKDGNWIVSKNKD